jgi:hypothetical protein
MSQVVNCVLARGELTTDKYASVPHTAHLHKCDHCALIWWHEREKWPHFDNEESHLCPHCGVPQKWKYKPRLENLHDGLTQF